MVFLVSTPIHMLNNTNIFWSCFKEALKGNKKNQDGKQHTLSIITNDFTYQELKTNLNVRELTFSFVGEHTILEACKHADIYGPGALSLSKPIITRNMEGLCSISNEYGYEVFSEIEGTLKKDIENIHFQDCKP
ncbi:10848_t:CDS:2 [Entrophospora sp. SA101]|nr:10848_t:CDS:2 [Entrophospora sp. SA101]